MEEQAEWKELENGVAVKGGVCVKGGLDGDNTKRALYVIGGSANSSNADYTGLQRFSFENKEWETIQPVTEVIKDRTRHGANYISRDNIIVIYGGSTVPGYDGLSSETFTFDLKPPYTINAFNSKAPPASKPFVLPWGEDSVLMVGGSDTNKQVFTFNPGGGWVDLGMELPQTLPEASVAQAVTFDLQDGSKILQTFDLGQSPVSVTTNVLLNPGYQLANGQLLGANDSPPSDGAFVRRQFLSNYPSYNDSSIPDTTRSDFSIAQGDSGLVAFVGGDENSTVTFFDQAENSWVPAVRVLGEPAQEVLQPSATSSSSTSSTPSATAPPASTSSEAASSGGGGRNKTWTILGGVLGGLCGLVAILIIVLLCIRNKRRERKRKEARKSYPAGKKGSNEFDFEDGTHPLRENGQAMGRSPVASQVLDRSSAAILTARPNENLIRRISSDSRLQPDQQAASYGIFRKEKSPLGKTPLAISKPMNPNLGDYQERPSIDLGAATPAAPVNATPLATIPSRNKSQRKTDEAWAKYFTGEKVDPAAEYDKPATTPRTAGGGGFWPGSGLASHPSAPKFAFRDSAGNTLQTRSVGTASPVLENGPAEPRARYMMAANAKQGRISNANSASDESSIYDDQDLDAAFSSGIPASVPNSPWAPTGNTWSGPAQRPLRDQPPPTATTASSGDRSHSTTSSGIPSFPMPASNRPTITQVQHPAATNTRNTSGQTGGYFPPSHQRDRSINTDVSWLNLGGNKPAGR